MFSIGDNVRIVFIPQKYKNKLSLHNDNIYYKGTVCNIYKGEVGVLINGKYNVCSASGLFWFNTDSIEKDKNEIEKDNIEGEFIMSSRMEKYNYVAIVNLVEDYNKKDYGFALYDSECGKCYDGCYVLVNPRDKITLGRIKEIMTVEEYGKNITKEVIGVCDMSAYNDRIEARQRELDRQKKEAQLRKELDERISKLKDIEYYNRMAKELADKDPKIANLVSELGVVVGE